MQPASSYFPLAFCAGLLFSLFAPAPSQTLTPVPRPAAKDTAAKPAAPADTLRGQRSPGDTLPTSATATRDSLAKQNLVVGSDTLGGGNDTVSYSAVRIRYRNDRFSLSDRALLTYRGSSLVADSIVYYSQDDMVEAMGAPQISDPNNPPILGYKMRYNLKTKVGEIYYGSSKKDNQTYSGVEIRRQKDGEVYIARGDFSTCNNPEHKHYFFYSRRMILEPKSKILSGPIVMDIAEVPVAILPMMVMPLGTGRRSGVLQPKFGGDQSQGFYFTGLGYYWAINEYMDAMLSGDLIEGERGTFDQTNLNWNYRYNKRYLLNGTVGGKYYISEFDPTRAGWHVDFAHDQNLTPDGRQTLKGGGRFQSDPNIVDDNAIDIDEKTKQTANANLGYRRQFEWNQATLNLDLSQVNNLTDNLIERDAPNFTFRVSGPLFPAPEADDDPVIAAAEELDDPWYRNLNWNYDNRANVHMVSRPALSGLRGDTNTYAGYRDNLSFTGKYSLFQYFNLLPSVNFGQMWTLTSRGDSADPVKVAFDPDAGEFGDYFPFFNTSLTMDTRIYGVAQAADQPWFGQVQGMRHTIIPSLGFTYAPEIDSNPHFLPNPRLAATAFQPEQKTVNMQLGNEVDMKLSPDSASKKPEPYKLLSANSSTGYNFARDFREWSDINSVFSLYFTRTVAFTLNTRHSLYDDFDAAGNRNSLVSPILSAYSYGWRKGLQVGGDFNSGLRVRDTQGMPTSRFEKTPWSADINYSFEFSSLRVGGGGDSPLARLVGTTGTFQQSRTHQAYGSLKLNPTAKWQMSYDTDYNFSEGKFSKHSFVFHRILHCWEMDFRWTPVGLAEGWNFNIRITELPDVKLETSDSKSRRTR